MSCSLFYVIVSRSSKSRSYVYIKRNHEMILEQIWRLFGSIFNVISMTVYDHSVKTTVKRIVLSFSLSVAFSMKCYKFICSISSYNYHHNSFSRFFCKFIWIFIPIPQCSALPHFHQRLWLGHFIHYERRQGHYELTQCYHSHILVVNSPLHVWNGSPMWLVLCHHHEKYVHLVQRHHCWSKAREDR